MTQKKKQKARPVGQNIPLCYLCIHGLRRGNFRECAIGKGGYKHIGEVIKCKFFQKPEEE